MGARTLLVLVAVFAVLGLLVAATSADYRLPGNQTGYEPEQPVRFSHLVHAGDLGIACLHCHTGAERGAAAGIPPTSLCMGCHEFVRAPLEDLRAEEALAEAEGRPPRAFLSPEIRKLWRAAGLDDDGKPLEGDGPGPIRWVRVHDLPDHAVFDHRAHVTAGVECATCHGAVDQQVRVRQVSPLSMGWCLDCHRQSRQLGVLPDGRASQASTDCSTCHH